MNDPEVVEVDALIEAWAHMIDELMSFYPGAGNTLREAWSGVRHAIIPCDCPLDPHHRWNCPLTPIWARTIRDLDTNPWTVVTHAIEPLPRLPITDEFLAASGFHCIGTAVDGPVFARSSEIGEYPDPGWWRIEI